MKRITFFLFASLVLSSCGSSPNEASSHTSTDETEIPEPEDIIADFNLDAEASSVTWDRFLDQKATKKQVKLFGALVDVEMGPMELSMNGEVTPTKGGVTTTNEACTSGNMFFDMTTFKFADERGEGLFDTKKFPESELVFESFNHLSGDSCEVNLSLTIQDHTEKYTAPFIVKESTDGVNIDGSFKFNTLDFPLRENAKKNEVNKDEITVFLKLSYK